MFACFFVVCFWGVCLCVSKSVFACMHFFFISSSSYSSLFSVCSLVSIFVFYNLSSRSFIISQFTHDSLCHDDYSPVTATVLSDDVYM